MAITKNRSRKILWSAIKSSLGISLNPDSLKEYFEDTAYCKLFEGWAGDLELADKKLAKGILIEYRNNNAEVDRSEEQIQNKSKEMREETDENKKKINNFFLWIHAKALESV